MLHLPVRPSRSETTRRVIAALATVYPSLLLALAAQHALFPQRSGLAALTQIFAPYLYLPLIFSLPFALLKRARVLRVTLLACLLVFGARFLPRVGLAAPDGEEGGTYLDVMAWNVEWGGDPAQVRPVLLGRPADVVALEESSWEWIDRDPEIGRLYPHRTGHKQGHPPGIVLLSVYPILEHGVSSPPREPWTETRLAWARLDIGGGRTLKVVVGHPAPPRLCLPPACFDPGLRDSQIPQLRALVDPPLAAGEPVLLVGDFNLTEREPAYEELSHGLLDAHRQVGQGWGHTWRPSFIKHVGAPLLRIDYMFSSPDVRPVRTWVDATRRGSDHCILYVRFEIR